MLKKILICCHGRSLQAGFVSGQKAIQLFLNAQAGIASKLLATAQHMQKNSELCMYFDMACCNHAIQQLHRLGCGAKPETRI